jgi:DNA-binding NarL/FixJ family response regulator
MIMLKKRIVVIDMDESFRFLMASVIRLSDKFVLAASYADPETALKQIVKDKPDIVVTDIYFPSLNPIEYVRLLLDKLHLIDVLVATDYEEDDLILETIAQGAVGYLLKKNALPRLMGALEAVAQGGSPLDERVARKLVSNLQITKSTPLTRQESVVLKLITQGKTYSMIANELHISNDTSKTHIKNIYRKLNVNSKTDAVRKAITERLVYVG